MKKDSPRLADYTAGAWVQNECKPFVKIGIRCDFDLSLVTPRVRSKVIQGLRTGVLDSVGGSAKAVFIALSDAYNLRWCCASLNGSFVISGFRHAEFAQQLIAANALVRGGAAPSTAYLYGNGFYLYNWRAQTNVARNLFQQIFGDDDKELREKAIDFLSEKGILTHSWIDNNPT